MPKVYNFHFHDAPSGAINIGRPSSFGNNFTHTTNTSLAMIKVPTRVDAVECYDRLIDCFSEPDVVELINPFVDIVNVDYMKVQRLIAQAEWIRRHLKWLRDKDLVCWCAPLPCHGDVLLRLANQEEVNE